MKVAIIGASGYVGSQLLKEAVARGHEVAALVSNTSKIAPAANVTVVQADVLAQDSLAEKLKGYDAVVSAFSGHAQSDVYGYYIQGIQSVIAAAKRAEVPRLLVVGGAGSLEVAPGRQLVDSPDFPAEYKASALGAREALNLLRKEGELNWTMLSPAAMLVPGERTGQFRVGRDALLTDATGESRISVQDYAVAMIDELEKPTHLRSRFTVAY